MEDISTFRCELKTAARAVVRVHFNLFPSDAEAKNMTPTEYTAYIRDAATTLLDQGDLLADGVDDEVRAHHTLFSLDIDGMLGPNK